MHKHAHVVCKLLTSVPSVHGYLSVRQLVGHTPALSCLHRLGRHLPLRAARLIVAVVHMSRCLVEVLLPAGRKRCTSSLFLFNICSDELPCDALFFRVRSCLKETHTYACTQCLDISLWLQMAWACVRGQDYAHAYIDEVRWFDPCALFCCGVAALECGTSHLCVFCSSMYTFARPFRFSPMQAHARTVAVRWIHALICPAVLVHYLNPRFLCL